MCIFFRRFQLYYIIIMTIYIWPRTHQIPTLYSFNNIDLLSLTIEEQYRIHYSIVIEIVISRILYMFPARALYNLVTQKAYLV